MKQLLCAFLVLSSLPVLAYQTSPAKAATCRGGSCRACKNCRYCGHCKGGGKCSVCDKANARIAKAEKAKRVAKR